MLEVFDRNRRRICILENAYSLSEELKINSLCYFTFSLPFTDSKKEFCQPYHYVRYNGGEFYRILPSQITLNEVGDITYRCEHVLALLIDNVLFGDHVVGNIGYYTPAVIQYVLNRQLVKHWVLGECDFNRQFEYGWSQETLLSALFSIPKRLVDNYMWTYNTKVYPYVLNLKLLTETARPQMYIRIKKNLLKLTHKSDPTNICTRLYPLGEGEGVNQLNIASINNGKPYLQSPQSYIDKYGIVERVWIDRRYTVQQSLYDAGVAMLAELQEPFEEYEVDCAQLGLDPYDIPEIGKIVEIVGFKKTYITGIVYRHEEVPTATLTIANKPKDVASTVADLADRQRIEMSYSQGATQFYQDHVYDNATPSVSLLLKLMIPSSMKIVNKINIDVEIGPFRKPFTVTGGGGGQTISQSNTTSSGASTVTTTAGGGGQTSGSSSSGTTSSGGATSDTSSSGGGSTSGSSSSNTTSSGGGATVVGTYKFLSGYGVDSVSTVNNHTHSMPNFEMEGSVPAHLHNIQHTHDVYAHTHNFSIGSHSHAMAHTHQINSHTHDMQHYHSIAHTHSIPNHTHSLDPGISFSGNPSGFNVLVNGVKIKTVVGKDLQMDITPYLVDTQNRIPRDTYNKIEIVPNDVAYVLLTVNVQGFIQSRGDQTV